MMLAIRRVLLGCIQSDLDVTEIDDSIKENSEVREADCNIEKNKCFSPTN